MRLYIDDHGARRAEVASPHALLGWFLEQDVQSSPPSCEDYLDAVRQVREGQLPAWSGTGNAHTVHITPARVRIETEFADPPASCELELQEFETALRAWLQFVKQARGLGVDSLSR